MLTIPQTVHKPNYQTSNISFKGNYDQLYKEMAELTDSLKKPKNKVQVKNSAKGKLKNFTKKIAEFWSGQSKGKKITIQALFAILAVGLGYTGGIFTRPATIEVQKQKIETLDKIISARNEELDSKKQEIKDLNSQITEKRQDVAELDLTITDKINDLDSISDIITTQYVQSKMLEQQQNGSYSVDNTSTINYESAMIPVETHTEKPIVKQRSSDVDNIDVFELCKNGNTEAVRKIIENYPDFDVNKTDCYGRSYIYRAIDNDRKGSHKELINLLAGAPGLDAGMRHANGYSDMYYLCVGGYDEAVKIYLDKHPDFDINENTMNGRSYMYRAIDNDVRGSHRKLVNVLAGAPRLDANIQHMNGHTDMYYLCEGGYTEAVKIYLDKHPYFDVNQRDGWSGKTYIEIAQKNKHNDIVNILIDFQMKN